MDKKEQLFRVAEAQDDLFCFLKYVKIQEPGELSLDYELWPHLIDFYHNLLDYQFIDVIKAKQIGVSWALSIFALWTIYSKFGFNVLEISKGDLESRALLAKSRVVYNNLPEWMKVFTLEPNSGEKFGFREIRSQILSFPSTETSGLGQTAGLVIHDEADFHPYFRVNLSHTRATVADSLERKLVAVSTVDKTKPDSYFKKHWKDARDGKNGFKALFYGYDVRPNRDQEFYDAMVRENESAPWVVEANYPRTSEEALSPLSTQSCFNKDRLSDLWDKTVEPETRRGYIYVFCPPSIGTQYVGGVDVGEGIGRDYSVLNIVGSRGLNSEVCAVIYTNKVGTAEFAYDVWSLCKEYFGPELVIDNIGIGRAVIDKLRELDYTRLFSSEADNKLKAGRPITGIEKAGFSLTRPNKRELVVKLVEAINDGSLVTRFKPQVKEMMEYQWVNDYPEPTGATHGDLVIALMLANKRLKEVGPSEKARVWIGGREIRW